MRKTLMILALLVFVLPLSAYSVNALRDSTIPSKPSTNSKSPARMIQRNQRIWDKQIAKADVIRSDDIHQDNKYVGTTLNQLKNHNKALIQGTVYNLQKMNSPQNMAYTKATIHIDKVISGDTTIKGKNIYVAFEGGLVSFDHWYANMGKPKDFDHQILVKNEEFTLPAIGSKVITGLIPNHLDEATEYNNSLKQSGFTINNSYSLDVPEYNFWVKKLNATKYVLNNPKVRHKNTDFAKELQKLTTKINQKYNH